MSQFTPARPIGIFVGLGWMACVRSCHEGRLASDSRPLTGAQSGHDFQPFCNYLHTQPANGLSAARIGCIESANVAKEAMGTGADRQRIRYAARRKLGFFLASVRVAYPRG